MTNIDWTSVQREAIGEVGRSIVVSAAAGSGKTAVLAARCAHLVCDAPESFRCGIDRLLVVTFAEDAAAEMRQRIRTNFQQRLHETPRDPYLREQVSLLDTAAISTMHSFCNWIIRRWFNKVDIDPSAPILPEQEGRVLKANTLDALFERHYESDDPAGRNFRELIDAYGLGDDGSIRKSILSLADYLNSLPDPEDWLKSAGDRLSNESDRLTVYIIDPLRRELDMQLISAEQDTSLAESDNRYDACYGERIAELVEQLRSWRKQLEDSGPPADRIATVQAGMKAFEMSGRGIPRVPKGDDDARASKEAAQSVFNKARERFTKRLRERFALFTPEETLDGLDRIQPHVATLATLVSEFRQAYQLAKRQRGVIDFSDQERLAHRLLQDPEVAGALRDRFDHILVDEYQDINPLQDALLRGVSREDAPDQPANLFTVGDVKQSIYGFRAADPDVFRQRIDRGQQEPTRSHTIHLRKNFRSHPRILESVNLLFEHLMQRDVGGIDYDEHHALNPGLPSQDNPSLTVDLHLLDHGGPTHQPDAEDEDAAHVDPDDPSEWVAIEREAYVIAARVRQLLADGMTVEPRRPLELSDIAILLRNASHTADRLATFLQRLGLNAHSRASAQAPEATELSDVRALLQVIDNTHQDIPLATVLRSNILGQPLSEDALLAIRNLDDTVPYHDTVRRYADEGDDPDLRDRVRTVFERITRLRIAARRLPVADLVRRILHDFGYLAYVVGLSNGERRRRNLLWFHQCARSFGDFRNQGLRRFLAYIEALNESDGGLGAAPSSSQSSAAIQIMTMHGCKGLEFPVVFVADLGRRFNLKDRDGRIIHDREEGLGLRVVDSDRMIEYATAARCLVSAAIERRTRAEELRLLYVAMTRAKNKLILLGRAKLSALNSANTNRSAVTPLDIETATNAADWIIQALYALPPDRVSWGDGSKRTTPHFRVQTHTADEMSGWRIEQTPTRDISPVHQAVASLAPLPPDEPIDADPERAEQVLARLSFVYPHSATCAVRAIVAASEIKSPYDALRDAEERYTPPVPETPVPTPSMDRRNALRRGTATHLLLQHLNFSAADGESPVPSELARLVSAGLLSESEASLVDTDAISWFIDTPLGRNVRKAGDDYHREFMFIAAHPADRFDPAIGSETDERVLVRGVVDGVLDAREHTEVIDFKTDIVTGVHVAARAERYAGQLNLYAAAIEPIFQKPVARSWLVFLHAHEIVSVPIDR